MIVNFKKTLKHLVVAIVAFLFLASIALAVYFRRQAFYLKKEVVYLGGQLEELRLNPQKFVQEEIQGLIAKVGKLVVLPEGEQPTIATVNDPEPLKSQPFFARTKKGDKVLIYTNARKAILYDPVENKIVEIAPVNIGPTQPANP